jgi:hypothetical protein
VKIETLSEKKQEAIKNPNKFLNHINDSKDFILGFKQGIKTSFSIFEEFLNIYIRYHNNVKLLLKEQKNVWRKWIEFYEKSSNISATNYLQKYNNWLFSYLFSFDENTSINGDVFIKIDSQ